MMSELHWYVSWERNYPVVRRLLQLLLYCCGSSDIIHFSPNFFSLVAPPKKELQNERYTKKHVPWLKDCFPRPDNTSSALMDISIVVDCIFSSSRTAICGCCCCCGGGGSVTGVVLSVPWSTDCCVDSLESVGTTTIFTSVVAATSVVSTCESSDASIEGRFAGILLYIYIFVEMRFIDYIRQ